MFLYDGEIIIGGEESQEIANAMRERGVKAYSCDLQDCSGNHPEYHLKMDLKKALKLQNWRVGIFHPTCTRLCNSGALRLYYEGKKENGIDPIKWEEMLEAAEWFRFCYDACEISATENPIMHGHALKKIGVKYSQIIQPYNFNENASKATCLWLKNLPLLQNTGYFKPRYVNGRKRWGNQNDGGQNNLGKNHAKERSKTYRGIATAIADQWLRTIQFGNL